MRPEYSGLTRSITWLLISWFLVSQGNQRLWHSQSAKWIFLSSLCNLNHNFSVDELWEIQYIPRNMHTVFALLCFVVVIHWLIFSYPSGLLHWHCGNLTIAPVPAKQPWWIWINTSCEFIMNDCITTTKQSTTKPCAYFLGYTVYQHGDVMTLKRFPYWRLFLRGIRPSPVDSLTKNSNKELCCLIWRLSE